MRRGGFDALDDALAASARRSFETWAQENPEPARKYGLARYVAYTQEQWAKNDQGGSDLDALARMMGRSEQKKAATQFIASEIVLPREFAAAAQTATGNIFQRAIAAVRERFAPPAPPPAAPQETQPEYSAMAAAALRSMRLSHQASSVHRDGSPGGLPNPGAAASRLQGVRRKRRTVVRLRGTLPGSA